MILLDVFAAFGVAFGAFLGARRGFWRVLANASSVLLGVFAGWGVRDVLAAALKDWGVAPPGDAVLGFFIPFALTSVYTRLVIGLWLLKVLGRRPEGNRLLGAVAGAVCALLLAGVVGNIAGIHRDAPERAPFAVWLASWPGELAGQFLTAGPLSGCGLKELGETAVRALDIDRAHLRSREADAEAFASWNSRSAEGGGPSGAASLRH